MENMRVNLPLDSILIMGILNVTPDSFSDGGLFLQPKAAIVRAKEMVREGADIIDIGGESTRPGGEPVSEDEELKRVLPVIKGIRKELGSQAVVSIDTYKARVAKEALYAGASMVNSLGGFTFDPLLANVASEYPCPFVIYHIKGKPKKMQKGEIIYRDVVEDIIAFFQEQITVGERAGMKREQFILDPGIGFGKTLKHNLEIIKRLGEFKRLALPLCIGVSRKSHLGLLLKEKLRLKAIPPPQERLEASLAETAIAALNGVNIIRTHDVLATKKFITVIEAINNL